MFQPKDITTFIIITPITVFVGGHDRKPIQTVAGQEALINSSTIIREKHCISSNIKIQALCIGQLLIALNSLNDNLKLRFPKLTMDKIYMLYRT